MDLPSIRNSSTSGHDVHETVAALGAAPVTLTIRKPGRLGLSGQFRPIRLNSASGWATAVSVAYGIIFYKTDIRGSRFDDEYACQD